MNPEIEELKQLIRQNTALTQEVHGMVKSLHRASIWSKVLRGVWIAFVVASAIGAFVFLGPYLQQIGALYESIQEALQMAQQQFGGGSPPPSGSR